MLHFLSLCEDAGVSIFPSSLGYKFSDTSLGFPNVLTTVNQQGALRKGKPLLGLIQGQEWNKIVRLLYIEGGPTVQILGKS